MVNITLCLLNNTVKKVKNKLRGQLIDSLRLTVKGGHGGNGTPKYGGVGGQGGCVYFIGSDDVTLKSLMSKYPRKQIGAGNGEESSKIRILGRPGSDCKIEIPTGITVYNDKGKKLGEINQPGDTCLAAGGGGGGCSGNSFIGHRGQALTVTLDLKLIADVGLVGYPNAGKSSLLKAISNALPKIASYPFTTIRPQLGTISYTDLRQITVADLPGLIEGAHANIGMGHKFLKHIERTRLLLMVVDIHGFQLSQMHKYRTCLETICSLNKELELYDYKLFEKPSILLLNKMDVDGSASKLEEIMDQLKYINESTKDCPAELLPTKFLQFDKIIPISAQENINIDKVTKTIRNVLDTHAERALLLEEEQQQEQQQNNDCKIIKSSG